MNRINIFELMTWKRRQRTIFPYGLSILPSICTSLLVLIPSIALLISLFSKQAYQMLGVVFMCNIFVHLFLIKCVMTNPGIIPQIVPNREIEKQLLSIPKPKIIEDERRYLIQNQCLNVYSKYCYECRIYRPLRAIHCWRCNHCVQKYDHHCPWLSVCIGKFNYIYFLGFIISLCVSAFIISAICLSIIITSVQRNQQVSKFIVQGIVGLMSLSFSFPLLRLVVYHLIIMKRKRTTNQDLKNIYSKKIELPFNSCYTIDRKQLFNQKTEYFMDKNHHTQSSRDLKLKEQNDKMNLILLHSLNRELNDSTDSSSSVRKHYRNSINQGNRYSITATERTSVFNYLIETDSN